MKITPLAPGRRCLSRATPSDVAGDPLVVLLTQPDSFAQREQFLVIFLLPYLVAASTEVAIPLSSRAQVIAVSQCTDDSHCQGLDRNLDIVHWFSADPQFAAEWAHYRRQGTIPEFDVYVRVP